MTVDVALVAAWTAIHAVIGARRVDALLADCATPLVPCALVIVCEVREM